MAIPKFKDVLYEETDGVATVTLNRPDRLNAIRVGMYEEITEALCDLAIASEIAQFEQVGPKVGAVDPVFGTALLARVVGQKKAREMWYLCRRYSARQARRWCSSKRSFLTRSSMPRLSAGVRSGWTAARRRSASPLNADSKQIRGISGLGFGAVALYYRTDEAKEAGAALRQKRKPKFR